MKNKFRIFTVAFLTYIFILGSNAYAFTNSDYYNNQNISIGLESMESSQLNITLNGDYNLNGVVYKSGTSYVLKVNGTKIDFKGTLYDKISFIPKNNSNTIKIVSNYSRNYLGTLGFKIDSSSAPFKIIPINTLYIEDYLKGVVGLEMSDSFPIEALKAQAVAARNYALANIDKHKAKGYSLCDTINCQVYGGYNTILKNVIAAVNATKGMLLLSGTSLVNAYYSASDGGYTEASENVWSEAISYLKAKQDSYDINYLWNKTYTNSDINNLFKLNPKVQPTDTFVKIDLSTITKFDSGRIKNISLIFKTSIGIYYTLSYGKEPARTFLPYLKSALYNVSYNVATATYSFDGKGYGHGVGMSQIGAQNRATVGKSFDSILKFYYEGTTLINALPKVTFNSQGGSAVTGKTADYNSVITAPVAPTKTGYTFGGWYKEAGCIDAWNFSTDKVTTDTTLYAKWTINKYTVTFNSQGGSAVTSKTAVYNSLITAPTSPIKTGYKFGGWYKEAGCLNVWNFITAKVTANTTLYAKWISQVQRLAGINRIETSIAIAKYQYANKAPDAVVLATANNFPDALAGSGLAYKYNAPLLLVDTTVSNSKNVLTYITTNLVKNKNIYVLGGTDVVSKDISDYLTTNGYKIIRFEGKDRYETNQKIVDYMNITKGTSIVLATGDNFADALSISSIAAIKGFPILLNTKDNLLANVSNDIATIQPTTVYIVGDAGVLSTNLETQITHLSSNTQIVRLGGLTRYDTSMKILEYFNLDTTTVTVATGLNFPDALSGSVLAARKNCGVLLVDNKNVTKQKALLAKQKITDVIVFGGADVVSNAIANSLLQ